MMIGMIYVSVHLPPAYGPQAPATSPRRLSVSGERADDSGVPGDTVRFSADLSESSLHLGPSKHPEASALQHGGHQRIDPSCEKHGRPLLSRERVHVRCRRF
jgi:hypothetical protein